MNTRTGLAISLTLIALNLSACGGQPGEGDYKPRTRQTGDATPGQGRDDGSTDAADDGTDGAIDSDGGGGGGDDADGGSPLNPPPGPPPPPPEVTSESAFTETLYPALRSNCQGCHAATVAPFFAHEEPALAHKAILESGKVNFAKLDRSRIYLRMTKDLHNCGDKCDAWGVDFMDQMEAWLDKLVKAGKPPVTAPVLESAMLKLADAAERDANGDPKVIAFEAESGTVTAPMVMTDLTTASGAKVIQVPTGAAINNANTANIGSVVYNFEVKEAGTYNVWALANAPTAASNRFFIRVDQGAFQSWTLTPNADAYAWVRSTDVNNAAIAVNLTAGPHSVEIRRSRTMAKLDLVAVTSLPTFDGSQVRLGKVKVLKFDLSEIAKQPNVFLEIEVTEFNETAYKFAKPTISVATGSVHVKGLRILLNGTFDPQLATYSLVDQTVAAPGGLLSPAAMVALKDKGSDLDEISVSFDALEIK